MATKPKSPEVTPPTTAAVLAVGEQLPAYMKQGAGRGSENVGTEDILIPRLEIVQAMSPIKESNSDARDGLLFNSVTQDILGDHVFFVPIYYRMEHLIWKDQNKGGGFFGSFPTHEQAMDRLSEAVAQGESPDDLEIVDTPVHFGLIVHDDGSFEQIVISMAKTKSRVSRRWNSIIQIAGGDRFSRVYKISTVTDENKKGQKFKNFVVQPASFTPENVYLEAERQYTQLSAGAISANHASAAKQDTADAAPRGEI